MDRIVITISGGCLTGVWITPQEEPVEVEILDFDNVEGDPEDEDQMDLALEVADVELQRVV